MDEAVLQDTPVSPDITTDEHIRFWSKSRESTQSSMSGLHYGFYKATSKCRKLAHTVANFIRIPFCTGYSPWRFRRSLNVSIMKEENNFKPEKQRTIHLLEANFSEGCKTIFSKRMLSNARHHKQIPEEQYARKGGKAIDAVLHKVLVYDYLRLTRSPGICFSSDLMNNYDRMHHAAGSLAMRTLGVPITALKCLFSSLAQMRHNIRTAYGDSDHYYSGTEEEPLQGTGQGNPASPPTWTALSIILLRILGMFPPGSILVGPLSLLMVTFTAIMYVDDTDLFVVGESPRESIDSVLERTKRITDKWCDALWATGGVMRPDKCFWYLIGFKWKGGRWEYVNKVDVDGEIEVMNCRGERERVRRHNPDVAEETLGVHLAVDGNMKKQKRTLTDKTNTWTDRIKNSGLYKNEVVMALLTTISRTWQYPVQATTLSTNDCDDIVTPLYAAMLPRMGCNQKIPKVFRYGPKSLLGLGLPHLHTMQGTAQIKAILYHISKDTMIGKLLLIELEAVNIELGVGTHLFDLDFQEWGFLLTDCWLKSVWEFCSDNNVQLHGKYCLPSIQRENDIFLIEGLLHRFNDKFTRSELQTVNRCRLYLQVLTMADITSGDGMKLCKKPFRGMQDSFRPSKWKWPMQACPIRSEWKVWQRAILFLSSGNVLGNSALQTPLGTWISDPHRSYKWLYSPSTNSVYHKVRCGWKKYTKSSRCRTSSDRRHYKLATGWADIPPDAQPTTIAKGPLAQQIWMEGGREKLSTPSVSTAMHWFQHAAESRSLEVWGLLRHTRFYVPEDILYQSLCRGNWKMVSDGSYHPDFNVGTAAVVLEDTGGTTLLSTYLKTPGAGDDINAFRSELAGAYAACLIINIIATHFKCEAVPVTLGCDNETTVFTALQASYYSPIMVKHFDLIWEIQSIIFQLPISLNAVHVKGHQSEEECRKSHLARINARADQLAKLYLS